ncbi:MAG: hypothetical protein JNM25_06500 [Planctomycetes bacterium]|nr:hypothetical protein [Planctomycetota bacterium]
MDTLQFTLFFLAIVVGYVVLHLRLVRFEDHLQKLTGIRSIDDRLRSLDDRMRLLVETLEKLQLDRIEQRLDRLHDDLEDVREATGEVRTAVVQIPSAPAGAPLAAAAVALPEAPGARIAALVEGRLLQLGYGNLQILTDLGDVRADRDVEVQVECERNSMPAKGRVLVRNGAVRDVALQTVAHMFP